MSAAVLMMPFPPTTNNLFASLKSGRRIKSESYRVWEREADFQLMQQKPLPYFDNPVMLTLHLGKPDKRKRDVSNTIKAVEDMLVTAGVLKDDELVHDVRARWDDTVQGCMCEITPLRPMIIPWEQARARAKP